MSAGVTISKKCRLEPTLEMIPSQGRTNEGGIVVKSSCPPNSKWPVALAKRPVPPVTSAVSWLSYTPGVSVGTGTPRKCRRFRRRWPQTSQRCQCREYYFHKDPDRVARARDEIRRPGEGSQLIRVSEVNNVCGRLALRTRLRLNVPRDSAIEGHHLAASCRSDCRDKHCRKAGEEQRDKKSCCWLKLNVSIFYNIKNGKHVRTHGLSGKSPDFLS